MRPVRVLLLRLLGLIRGRQRDAALDAEVDAIFQLAADEHLARGLTADAAREAARRELGSTVAIKEASREQRGLPPVERLLQDIRNGARTIQRTPLLSAIVVVTLAVAIGANAAIYAVVDAVLVRPLPFAARDRMVWISEGDTEGSAPIGQDLQLWLRESRAFESLAGIASSDVTLSGENAARVRAVDLTAPLGRIFGLTPISGRDFTDDDFAAIPPGAASSAPDGAPSGGPVILSHRLFRSRFGGDSAIVGHTVLVGRVSYTVIGVAPPGMRLPIGPLNRRSLGAPVDPDVFFAIAPTAAAAVIARLKPGVPVDVAQSELRALRAPLTMRGDTRREVHIRPLAERIVGDTRRSLVLLWGACGLVLLIAAANVAGLLVARGAARRRELAVRAALGAGRTRLARLLLVEAAILASAGAAAGLLLATTILRVVRSHPELSVPRLSDVSIDIRVLAFTAGLAIFATLVAGVLPVMLDSGVPAAAILSDAAPHAASRRRLQRGLVVVQIAIAATLLTSAGLLLKSLAAARSHDGPLAASTVLTIRVEPYEARRIATPADRRDLLDTLISRIESLPQVSAAALWNVPYIFAIAVEGVAVSQQPFDRGGAALWITATDHFGAASGVPVLAGRWFGADDRDRTNVVVSEAFMNRMPPELRRPSLLLGRRIRGLPNRGPGSWTIVGVVKDFRTGIGNGAPVDDDSALFPQVFYPHQGAASAAGDLLVRSNNGDPLSLVRPVTTTIRSIGGMSAIEPRTLDEQIASAIAPRRFLTATLTAFAAVAIFLAGLGIAGLLAYGVATSTREIGIRIAIGARPPDVLAVIMRDGIRIVAAGALLGTLASVFVARASVAYLYRVAPLDPSVYLAALACLVTMGLVAAWGPALRATHIHPVEAMRHD